VNWTLNDLILLREADVAIDTDVFAAAFEYENRNYTSVALPCVDCGATPLAQHSIECKHATILVLPDWYEEIQRRETKGWIDQLTPRIAVIRRGGREISSPAFATQEQAVEWLRSEWREGDELIYIYTPRLQ
jgi:hypothetical protein